MLHKHDHPSRRPKPSLEEYADLLRNAVDYVYDFEVTSVKAVEAAHLALLDALGCARGILCGSMCPNFLGPTVRDQQLPSWFRLPGTSHNIDSCKGAFDLGVLIRYLDHNDAFVGAE